MKTPLRLCVALMLTALAVSLLPAEDKKPAGPKTDGEFKPLFNGKNLDGWVNVNCHPGTFFAKGGEIITTGNPTGFLRTDKQYENFVMEFEWMHVEKEKMANSGLFVWGDPLPAVGTGYTRGIEVQVLINYAPKDGWATSHGDIFSIWGAKCVPDRPHPTRKGMERCLPSENRVKGGGEWNHYKVTGNDGAIKLEVNGKEVSGVSKCTPRKGYLALESEGVECHFKNLKIKELPSTNPKPEEVANVAVGHKSLFTGVDLKGWTAERDTWKAGGGILRCTGRSDLSSDGLDVGAAELVFDCKLPAKGDGRCEVTVNGMTFAFTPGGEGVVSGTAVGLAQDRTKGAKLGKPGAWNRVVLTAKADEIVATVNGEKAGALKGVKARPTPITVTPADGLELMNLFLRELKEKK